LVNPTRYQSPVVRQNPVVIGQPAIALQLTATFHKKLCAITSWDKVLIPIQMNQPTRCSNFSSLLLVV
jgi:hypothetical protein